MNIDGVFLHHLVNELKPQLEGLRINKFLVINSYEFAFLLQSRKYLYFSLNSNSPHVRITQEEIVKTNKTNPFLSVVKKYCESSIIQKVEQNDNDRSLSIYITSFDELGYSENVKFIIELFGRNSNAILVNDDNMVIDCYKRLLPNDKDLRTLLPKAPYESEPTTKVNPFTTDGNLDYNNFQGVSSLCFNEMVYCNNQDIIKQNTIPTLIEVDKKHFFYCFPLKHLGDNNKYFDSLSELLKYYFYELKKENRLNDDQVTINNFLNKSIKRCESKLIKQKQEKQDAIKNLKYEKLGNLLSSNLHLITKNAKEITVYDYYDNKDIVIQLNPNLSKSDNLNSFYNKYKKAKRSLEVIDEQIKNTENEIVYYNCLLDQLKIAKNVDISEIFEELNIKKTNIIKRKKQVPNITVYEDKLGNRIYVGKNNIQNNYLTHSFAKSNDIFFHVQGYSGSHTVLRSDNPTKDVIELAAMIATYYSKSRESSNVAVDYTFIKFVKKVPGTLGSFVTYKNQKTVFATPNLDEIEAKTNRIK